MRVFLTGATGFIGSHALQALVMRGHQVTCLARPPITRLPVMPQVSVVTGEWVKPETWVHHLCGHDAVVNTVGIIRERPENTFQAVHTDAAIALFDAARHVDIRKAVQVSALGADADAVSRFHLSKRAADLFLTTIGVPYVVLRPSLVYGSGDHSMTFFSHIASWPITPIPGDGQYEVQPVSIDDVIRALVMSVERDDLHHLTVDLGGGRKLTFNALLDTLSFRQGGSRKLYIPWLIMQIIACLTDLSGYGPITSDELTMLRHGNWTDNTEFMRYFSFGPRPFPSDLAIPQPV